MADKEVPDIVDKLGPVQEMSKRRAVLDFKLTGGERGQGSGGEVTPSADLYSLAVILYELLTGELPFTADTPVAVVLKHISDVPPSVRLRAPDLPPAMDKVLKRALAKHPEERYPNGAALVEAVEEAWGLDAPTWPPPGEER